LNQAPKHGLIRIFFVKNYFDFLKDFPDKSLLSVVVIY
jgi:hypothetical protein